MSEQAGTDPSGFFPDLSFMSTRTQQQQPQTQVDAAGTVGGREGDIEERGVGGTEDERMSVYETPRRMPETTRSSRYQNGARKQGFHSNN